MILIIKTSDQMRHRGHTLSLLVQLCFPICFLAIVVDKPLQAPPLTPRVIQNIKSLNSIAAPRDPIFFPCILVRELIKLEVFLMFCSAYLPALSAYTRTVLLLH